MTENGELFSSVWIQLFIFRIIRRRVRRRVSRRMRWIGGSGPEAPTWDPRRQRLLSWNTASILRISWWADLLIFKQPFMHSSVRWTFLDLTNIFFFLFFLFFFSFFLFIFFVFFVFFLIFTNLNNLNLTNLPTFSGRCHINNRHKRRHQGGMWDYRTS